LADSKHKVRGYADFDTRERVRNKTERIVCILNPRARAGTAGSRIDELKRALERCFEEGEVVVTEAPGHATQLAREAVEGGADIIAAVGGDGTCNEVVNGLFDGDRPRRRSATFALIPWGTGGDLARSIKAPGNLSDALWVAAMGMTLPTDVGHVSFTRPDGQPAERVFLNVAGFGANGEVVARVNRGSKRLGGTISFLGATLATLGSYKPADVELKWEGVDGPGEWRGQLLSAFVANAHYAGGGMYVGRGGSMHDGWFDLSILPPMGMVRSVSQSWRLYDGSIDKVSGAVRARVRSLEARCESGGPLLLDVDGEQPGQLPASFKVLHRTIQVRGGWVQSPLLDEERPTWKPGATRR
jgi:diacylglycerol kinase (ATP)